MKLYNTLTGQVEPFTPLQPSRVGLYSCGPTVYDHIHIGNLSAFIIADTLRRALHMHDFAVRHVMNLTDVEDKTIGRSRQEYPDLEPNKALATLTQKYSQIFMRDMRAVGNDTTVIEFQAATAPHNIAAMKALVTALHQKGFAYITADGVYFSIAAYLKDGKTYGQLSHVPAPDLQQARIHNDEYDKDSANDFVLWKTKKDDEPSWEFTLDGHNLRGRPGWHIECSAMSTHTLGQPFDIHTGGIDLIFPHHENEIAQSTAGHDPMYARYFVHNEHVLVDGRKMSKSLQNFYTLQDIQAKGFEPLAFRLLVLQSHYRSQAHFTWDNLQTAQNRLLKFRNFAARLHQGALPEKNSSPSHKNHEMSNVLRAKIGDDLDTPGALAAIENYITSIEKVNVADELELVRSLITQLDAVFGLDLAATPDIAAEAKNRIRERQTARDAKDWALADELRYQLQNDFGLGINDTPTGSVWYRL